MLDHHHGIALGTQPLQGLQEQAIVPGMQADGGFIEDVADTAQVRTQLRRQPDALHLPAAERRGGAIQREVVETQERQQLQPTLEFVERVGGDSRFPPLKIEPVEDRQGPVHRKIGILGNIPALEMDRQRLRTQSPTIAGGTDLPVALAGGASRHSRTTAEICQFLQRTLPRFVPRGILEFDTGAAAMAAPAVSRIEGKHSRIEFREAGPAPGTGAAGGVKHRGVTGIVAEHGHPATAEVQRPRQELSQGLLGLGNHGDLAYG